MQALVIAHACYGHNSFFKNNYLFKSWTDASSIVDYFVFARKFIADCEERYGAAEVESLLDACHALKNYGTDRYKRPYPISAEEEKARQEERAEYVQRQINDLWRTIPKNNSSRDPEADQRFPSEPQENLLYFIEKNAPLLEPWQREVIRIVRKIAQYFYPQRQTQVMNEGWATFWHYTILNDLFDQGLVTEGFMMEFLHSHSSVVAQPAFDSPYFSGINPYALGFAMMRDIKRICESPTEEDKQWFPELAGSDWLSSLHFAMQNYKDVRDFQLYSIIDNDESDTIDVSAIHNEQGYYRIREELAQQYNLSSQEPDIQVYEVDIRGDRSLSLHHNQNSRMPLNDETEEVLKHLHHLWGFDVYLFSYNGDEVKHTIRVPGNGLSLV